MDSAIAGTAEDQIVGTWVSQFNEVLERGDSRHAASLFAGDGYLRDVVALTWSLHTYHGRGQIERGLRDARERTGPRSFRLGGPGITKRKTKSDGTSVVETILDFDTRSGAGQAVLRLVASGTDRYEAWVLSTCLRSLNDRPERLGAHRPKGTPSLDSFAHKAWAERREEERAYRDREPEVLVVGAGHSGLGVAARLRVLGIDTLVCDRLPRLGDTWRNRYRSLTLHNAIWVNHLPYMPFPDTWPVYIPKDKLANWLELYAESMELNVWTGTELEKASYDEESACWHAVLRNMDGTSRVVCPKHIVMATGASGVPRWPTIEGMSDFRGTLIHSGQYQGWGTVEAAECVIFGTGNSAHDIAQDLHMAGGCHVTMVQRSPTTVVDLPTVHDIYDRYSTRLSAEHSDLMLVATPYDLSIGTFQAMTKLAIERDRKLIEGLHAVGFRTDYGDDGTGHRMKYLRRGGGYYINVGCSNLIVDGAVDLRQFDEIDRIVADGVRLKDGTLLAADLIVMATGYENQQVLVQRIFGDEVAARVGEIWGYDAEGELRGMYKQTGQPGLWFHAGSMTHARIFSRLLALQISGSLSGLIPTGASWDDVAANSALSA